MKPDEILAKLKERFVQVDFYPDENNPEGIYLPPAILPEVAQILKTDSSLAFGLLNFVTAVDYVQHFELVYQFSSYSKSHRLVLKVKVPRQKPEVPSLSAIYPTANWHERETYDLFGILFLNHPELTRLFLPDDWEGYPMRKDFVHENLIPLPEVS